LNTAMFKRGKICLVADIIQTVIEPLGNSRQVVFFVRDKMKNIYRVPKSEVVMMGVINSANKPSLKSAKQKRKDKKANRSIKAAAI